jgi:alpha-tubulin suppressor-like RCC1 family protein
MQSAVTAAAGHGLELSGSGAGGALLSGVTFEGIRNSAMHATDALGSWTVEGNLCRGPIGEHGMAFAGGDANVTLRSNQFEGISGDAMRASDALGSWTVEGNLCRGPIGGDAISIAGGSAEASMNISNNTFEQINGNAISAQDALGSWTVEGNLCRGPIGGHAMHFHNQSGTVAMTNNTINGSARGALVNGGSGTWTITGNTVGGAEQGAGPSGGFEFVGLAAEGSLSVTGNTLNHVGGVAMSFMDSKAAATVTGNTMSNSWGDQGGQLLSTQGIGLVVVDSSALTIDGNTIQNNSYAGVLIDLAWWDTGQDGAAAIIVRNNTVDGHDSRRNLKRQFIPQDASITVENNDIPPLGPPRPGDRPAPPVTVARGAPPAPPRCGDEVVDPGEECDVNDPNAPINCSEHCSLLTGFRQIDAYQRSICATTYEGKVNCLGYGFGAQLNAVGVSPILSFTETRDPVDDVNFVQTALGASHGCGLTQNGRIYCWGNNSSKQVNGLEPARIFNVPQRVDHAEFGDLDVNPFVSLHVARDHSCGRRANGHVWCWGTNNTNALGLGSDQPGYLTAIGPTKLKAQDPEQPGSLIDLVTEGFWTGSFSSCASVEHNNTQNYHCVGQARAGGDSTAGFVLTQPVRDSENTPLTVGGSMVLGGGLDRHAGLSHSCALNAEGLPFCWGSGDDHRLGNNTTQDRLVATMVTQQNLGYPPAMRELFTLRSGHSIGHGHDPPVTCGLTLDGELWCWGTNTYNILPEGTEYRVATRVVIDGVGRLRSLAISRGLACGIEEDYRVVCWGADTFKGETLGTHQSAQNVALSEAILDQNIAFEDVAVKNGFGVARAGTRAYWWGQTPGGTKPVVTPVDAQHDLANVTMTDFALTDEAVCWSNDQGVNCYGAPDYDGSTMVGEGIPYVRAQIRCGDDHCCSFQAGGSQVMCWGVSRDYEAGQHNTRVVAPETFTIQNPIVDLALGDHHSCALASDGVTWCWGVGADGVFATLNDISGTRTPERSHPGFSVASLIVAAPFHNCGFSGSHPGVICWGRGSDSLAMGTDQVVPVPVSPIPNSDDVADESETTLHAGYAFVSTSALNTCYDTDSGRLACIGDNTFGTRAPEITNTNASGDPQLIPNLSAVTAASVHSGTGCAITNEGLKCWGRNSAYRTATKRLFRADPYQQD